MTPKPNIGDWVPSQNIEDWVCPNCGEVNGPRAGYVCHGPGATGACNATIVPLSKRAARRLKGRRDGDFGEEGIHLG